MRAFRVTHGNVTVLDLPDVREGAWLLTAERGSADRLDTAKTGIGLIDEGLEKWNANPGLMLYKLQAKGTISAGC